MEKVMKRDKVVIVAFKSIRENYVKEQSGIKNNTVRRIDLTDERFKLLKEGKVTHIMIHLVNTLTFSFIREIKDITEFNGYMIITWGCD